MFIIKNRVNGEYDTRGYDNPMDTFNRSSWGKLSHAKNHVVQKMTAWWSKLQYVDWYIDADYIELDETGTLSVTPVVDHLRKYFEGSYHKKYLTPKQREKIGLK